MLAKELGVNNNSLNMALSGFRESRGAIEHLRMLKDHLSAKLGNRTGEPPPSPHLVGVTTSCNIRQQETICE